MSARRLLPTRNEIFVFVAAWTVIALLAGLQWQIGESAAGRPLAWGQVVWLSLLTWYPCALASLIVVAAVRIRPLEASSWIPTVGLYLGAILIAIALRFAIYVPIHNAAVPAHITFMQLVRAESFAEFMTLATVAAVVLAIEYYRAGRERELRAARLEADLAKTRLDALTGQLHPHFLFNTLHGVSTLMHRDVEAADTMLAQLSDLLRFTLRKPEVHEIALREELELLARYTGIMQLRYESRLCVRVDVSEHLCNEPVPTLMLQPIVENALRHGLDSGTAQCAIEISARADATTLRITVRDNGPGLRAPGEHHEGIGLANTRRRLEHLYGSDAWLSVENGVPSGVVVTIGVPRLAARRKVPVRS